MSPACSPVFPHTKKALLEERAKLLKQVRTFFEKKHVLEVDCPALSPFSSIDVHIDPLCTGPDPQAYLHTSAEYGMKRLLSMGVGDLYQLSHVFRKDPITPLHQMEFMMIEWYRIQMPFTHLIEETCELIHLFLEKKPIETLTYQEAMLHFAGIDPFNMTAYELTLAAKSHDLYLHEKEKDLILNAIWGCLVEPQLGKEKLTVITEYPASEAALALTYTKKGISVAERFEIYSQGIELANGYHELRDPIEQKKRLLSANQKRINLGKESLPLDSSFLEALEKGLPDCCGVAVGFDRLVMRRHHLKSLEPILPFPWTKT